MVFTTGSDPVAVGLVASLGITGWAQVNGFRGETDTDEKMKRRVDHDHYYIDNWSFWFDLRILVLTLFSRGQ